MVISFSGEGDVEAVVVVVSSSGGDDGDVEGVVVVVSFSGDDVSPSGLVVEEAVEVDGMVSFAAVVTSEVCRSLLLQR